MERKASRSAVVALAIAGLLIAYPVSIGPVYGLCHYFDIYQPAFGWFEAFFTPLIFLPDQPLGDWIDQWVWFCRDIADGAKGQI